MIYNITIIQMRTDQSFIHLIKSFMGKNFERYLMIPIPFLAFMIFSLACLSKDNFESSVRPNASVP